MPAQAMKATRFLLIATAIYGLFFLRGMAADHYLDWSLDFKIGDCIEIIIFTVPLTYLVLRRLSSKPEYFRDACWLALSFSIPYGIYDLILLGYVRGHGINYLSTFWFLTIFYFVALIEIPVIGYIMHRDDPSVTKAHLSMLAVAVLSWGLNRWEGSFSNHYSDWALNMKIVRTTNVVLMLAPICWITLRLTSRPGEYRRNAAWLALYFSFTFVLFDYLYTGIARGNGLTYIPTFWHASILYPIFWIEIPGIGAFIERTAHAQGPNGAEASIPREEQQETP